MNITAEVYLWGTRVGIIHQELDKLYASFEYDTDFLKSEIEIITNSDTQYGYIKEKLPNVMIRKLDI